MSCSRSWNACPTPTSRFQVNINGFLERQRDNTLQFTVGNEVRGARMVGRVEEGVKHSRLGP